MIQHGQKRGRSDEQDFEVQNPTLTQKSKNKPLSQRKLFLQEVHKYCHDFVNGLSRIEQLLLLPCWTKDNGIRGMLWTRLINHLKTKPFESRQYYTNEEFSALLESLEYLSRPDYANKIIDSAHEYFLNLSPSSFEGALEDLPPTLFFQPEIASLKLERVKLKADRACQKIYFSLSLETQKRYHKSWTPEGIQDELWDLMMPRIRPLLTSVILEEYDHAHLQMVQKELARLKKSSPPDLVVFEMRRVFEIEPMDCREEEEIEEPAEGFGFTQ